MDSSSRLAGSRRLLPRCGTGRGADSVHAEPERPDDRPGTVNRRGSDTATDREPAVTDRPDAAADRRPAVTDGAATATDRGPTVTDGSDALACADIAAADNHAARNADTVQHRTTVPPGEAVSERVRHATGK